MKMEGLEMQGEQMRLEFESRSENVSFTAMRMRYIRSG